MPLIMLKQALHARHSDREFHAEHRGLQYSSCWSGLLCARPASRQGTRLHCALERLDVIKLRALPVVSYIIGRIAALSRARTPL